MQQGQLGWSRSFSAADVVSVQAREGVRVHLDANAPEGGDFYISFPDLTDNCLAVTGSVRVPQFNVDFDMQIRSWQLQHLRFVATKQVVDEIALTVTCDGTRDREWPLAQFTLGRFIVMVGWLPVVFTPQLDLVLGIDGTVSAGMIARVSGIRSRQIPGTMRSARAVSRRLLALLIPQKLSLDPPETPSPAQPSPCLRRGRPAQSANSSSCTVSA